jgi:hypothetical protein
LLLYQTERSDVINWTDDFGDPSLTEPALRAARRVLSKAKSVAAEGSSSNLNQNYYSSCPAKVRLGGEHCRVQTMVRGINRHT